jgi:hypothetical protein
MVGAGTHLFPRIEAEYADAHLILCPGDRAPFGLIDFFTGATAVQREGATHVQR